MSEAKKTSAAKPTQPTRDGAVARRGSQGPRFKPQTPVSRDAQRVAAAILEVLAGVRTPTEAAAAVSLSVPRYYLWEQRALEGLVRACEPRPQGKAASERHQIAVLEKEVARLRQDCARQQALVRASQRTIGLATSPSPAAKAAAKSGGKLAAKAAEAAGGKAKRKRRPMARALKAVAALQATPETQESLADSSLANGAEVVQRSILDSLLQAAAAAGPDTAQRSTAVPET